MISYTGKTCAELGIETEALTSLEHLRFYDVRGVEEFRIYGLYEPRTLNPFRRLPADIAEATSERVAGLVWNTAGGRLRFVTDSSYIAVRTTNKSHTGSQYTGTVGTCGFDLYIRNADGRDTYRGTFIPPVRYENGFDAAVRGLGNGMKEVTIHFPTYHRVSDLYIGLDETATLARRGDYKYEKPVLYYGSSITQGGCASRPGMAYEAIIARKLDCNYVNLGFAGACRAEDVMIDYLATLDPSVFVIDYDHNAPTAEHLAATHEKLYLAFRAAHPTTPVIIVTRPDSWAWRTDTEARTAVIRATYEHALARGEDVTFIDGRTLFAGELYEDCTVDGVHPSDLGMSRMAAVIGKAVEAALARAK